MVNFGFQYTKISVELLKVSNKINLSVIYFSFSKFDKLKYQDENCRRLVSTFGRDFNF